MKVIECPKVVEAPVMSPAAQLLWNAAAYMERHGKATAEQDGLGPNGEVCVIRAVCRALDRPFFGIEQDAIDRFELFVSMPVTTFSDNSDQATVIAAMRSAALL